MTPNEQRTAAQANQRAAAFIRFQMLGDHEAMHLLMLDMREVERLGFITALASIASSLATKAMDRDEAVDYFRLVAETSAALAESGGWEPGT